jgi:cholesterol transport system auxiliary component
MNFCVRGIANGVNAELSRERIFSFAAVVAAMAVLVVASGCGSARPIKYYQISPPPAVAAPSGEPINVGIIVRLPLASHIYREDPIVYASDAYQMGTYDTHRWAEPPAEMLQSAVVRGLHASGRFRAVQSQRSSSTGEYLLVSQLYAFNEITGANMAARLSYDVDLRELKTGNVVWSHSYNHDEPSAGRDVPSLVAAMDKNVQRSVLEIEAGLDDYFKNHPVK